MWFDVPLDEELWDCPEGSLYTKVVVDKQARPPRSFPGSSGTGQERGDAACPGPSPGTSTGSRGEPVMETSPVTPQRTAQATPQTPMNSPTVPIGACTSTASNSLPQFGGAYRMCRNGGSC